MKSLSQVSEKIVHLSSLLLIFLFPLFFLPTTANFFETNKLMLLVVVVGIGLGAWGLNVITKKELPLTITPFTLPSLGLGLAFILSTFFAASNPTDSLIGRGTFFPALVLFMFVVVNMVTHRRYIIQAVYTLIGSAVVLSFISIFQSLGFGLSSLLNRFLNTNIPDTLAFTPAGSPIALLGFVTPILILTLFLAFSRRESLEKIVLFLLSAVMTAGVVLVMAFSFPGKDTAPVFLPPQAGYAITMETLKNTSTALLGYGPENFVNAYNRTRPAFMNLSDYWNVRFTSSTNELFQTVTTTGIVGLAAWIILTIAIIRSLRTSQSSQVGKVIKLVTGGVLFLLLLIPATYPHLFVFFILLTLYSLVLKFGNDPSVHDLNLNLNTFSIVRPDAENGVNQNPIPVLPYLVGLPIIIFSTVLFYLSGTAYLAEMTFKNSLDAAAQNDGLQTYNLQRDAIVQNPYVTRYRRAYSATNLALANSISSADELTDQDRANVSQLIQQSIREAKAAVTLDPVNSANWENLTFVYRSLINVAEGADSWTIASLAQAIQNDPINPRLRLELGGVYYALGRYDQAIRLYQQSAELKPNWANAYYNLSAAHQQKEELPQAFDYLRQVLSLVDPDTADYAKAQGEIEVLAEKLNVPEEDALVIEKPQGELQTPEPIPSPNPETQVELPENAGPDNLENQPVEEPTEAPEAASPTPEEPTPTPQP